MKQNKKNLKKIWYFFILLSLFLFGNKITLAGIPTSNVGLSDLNPHPAPSAPTLPSAGGTFIDPTFGSKIMRLTDPGDGDFCQIAYSNWPAFNSNSTKLIAECQNTGQGYTTSKIFSFNPQTFTRTGVENVYTGKNPDGKNMPSTEGAMWSHSDPNVFFAPQGSTLWAYNVTSKQFTKLKEFSSIFPGKNLSQMHSSQDDNRFSFGLRDSSSNTAGYGVWDKNQDKIVYTSTEGNNEVTIDKTGNYLFGIYEGAQYVSAGIEGFVVDLNAGIRTQLTDDFPDWNVIHHDTGYGFMAGEENHENHIIWRDLTNPHNWKILLNMEHNWNLDKHFSLIGDDSWLIVSAFGSTGGTASSNNGPWGNEIYMVATDGSGQVRRLAHHHSAVGGKYWHQPHANGSMDGKFIVFGSDWGNSNGRIDVFILDIISASSKFTGPTQDTTKPTGIISGVSGGQTYSGNVVLKSRNLEDNNVVSAVQYRMDNSVAVSPWITNGPFYFTWDTTKVTDGNHIMYVIAKDGSGNTMDETIAKNNYSVLVKITNGASSNPIPTTTTPPTISTISTGSINQSSASITWATNETSDTQVDYGTTASYGSSSSLNSSLVTNHSVSLSGLTASTLYHYRVKSRDGAGNLATSSDQTFTTTATTVTTPPPPSTPPVAEQPQQPLPPPYPNTGVFSLSGINVTFIKDIAYITYMTSIPTAGQVDYGLTTYYKTSFPEKNLSTSHSLNITGLSLGTTYHYRIVNRDINNSNYYSQDYYFTVPSDGSDTSKISAITPNATLSIDKASLINLSSSATFPQKVRAGDILRFKGLPTIYLVYTDGLYPFTSVKAYNSYRKKYKKTLKIYKQNPSLFTLKNIAAEAIINKK